MVYHSSSFAAPPRWTKINWLLVSTKTILSKPWRWIELKGQVFSLMSTSASILIGLKAISGPSRRHPVGAPLVFSLSVTWSLWSVSSTWTIYPLSYLNLISRLISIVSPSWVTKLFTQMQPIASSERTKGYRLLPSLGFRQHFCSPPVICLVLSKDVPIALTREYLCHGSVNLKVKPVVVIQSLSFFSVHFKNITGFISLLVAWGHFILSQTSKVIWGFVLCSETAHYQLWFNWLSSV